VRRNLVRRSLVGGSLVRGSLVRRNLVGRNLVRGDLALRGRRLGRGVFSDTGAGGVRRHIGCRRRVHGLGDGDGHCRRDVDARGPVGGVIGLLAARADGLRNNGRLGRQARGADVDVGGWEGLVDFTNKIKVALDLLVTTVVVASAGYSGFLVDASGTPTEELAVG
jgi:hypothetical protein